MPPRSVKCALRRRPELLASALLEEINPHLLVAGGGQVGVAGKLARHAEFVVHLVADAHKLHIYCAERSLHLAVLVGLDRARIDSCRRQNLDYLAMGVLRPVLSLYTHFTGMGSLQKSNQNIPLN